MRRPNHSTRGAWWTAASRITQPVRALPLLLANVALGVAGCRIGEGRTHPAAIVDTAETDEGYETGHTAGSDSAPPPDADGDGFVAPDDCDDGDADVHPGAPERCDARVDTNCDGTVGCDQAAADATAIHISGDPGQAWGSALGTMGDLDGDGVDEIVTATSAADNEVAVLPGAAPTGALSAAWLVHLTTTSGAVVLGRAPDVDGDGSDDLITGDSRADPAMADAGVVYLIPAATASGTDSSDAEAARTTVTGSWESGFLGEVGLVGLDWDGDGDGEVAARGSDGDRSSAFVLEVDATGTVTEQADARMIVHGEANDEVSTLCAGDVTSDGLSDLLVRTGAQDDGTLGLFEGTSGAPTERLVSDADRTWTERGPFADTCAAGGDYDGDGIGDVLVGSYLMDIGGANIAGRASFYLSSADPVTVEGLTDDEAVGSAVVFLPDVDFDGRDEAAVAARERVIVIDGGRTGALTAADAYATVDVAAGGRVTALVAADLDHDGRGDLVFADASDDDWAGAIYRFDGADLFP